MTKYFVQGGNKYFYYVKIYIIVIISQCGEWQCSKANKSQDGKKSKTQILQALNENFIFHNTAYAMYN